MPKNRNKLALSPTEKAVAIMVAQGLTNKEIAEARVVSHHTTRSATEWIFAKLGLRNRVEVTLYALKNGMITLDEACATAGIEEEA